MVAPSVNRGQNTSSAVMQQRREPKDSLDLFPTPLWATRALCEWIKCNIGRLCDRTVWEPACGLGHMVRALSEYFAEVHASDVYEHSYCEWVQDFLYPTAFPNARFEAPDWIITNPPFRLAQQFIERSLPIATEGVAIFARTAFLESRPRYAFFKDCAPTDVLQFVERVPLLKGRVSNTTETATAYCWLLWRKGVTRDRGVAWLRWIPPCRKELERAGDYI